MRFRLAVQRRYKGEDGKREADFFSVVCWRGLAEIVKKYLRKGDKCAVIGSIHNRTWKAEDGTNRYSTEIVVDELELLGSRQQRDEPGEEQTEYRPQTGVQQSAFQQGFTQVDDDELPF